VSDEFLEIRELLKTAERQPEEPLLLGASESQLMTAESILNMKIPVELEKWLRIVNGSCVGGKAILGVALDRRSLDAVETLEFYTQWKEKGWFPVACDGCGNFYVLVLSHEPHPVAFVDVQYDSNGLAYLVASRLTTFIRGLIGLELGEKRWPFDRAFVIQSDPGIACLDIAPLPWDLEP